MMSGSKRVLGTMFGLAAASVVLYAPSLVFDFVRFDDHTVLLAHPRLYDESSLLASLREIVSYFPREEPLLVRDLSWAVDSRLFGFRNPFGYHLGNVLWNAIDVSLLYLLVWQLTRAQRLSLVVAGLFAVLPVHVEAVCWVMGRKDVLSAGFVLACLNLECAALRASPSRQRWYRLASLLLCPLAMLSKISAVTLVGVIAIVRLFWPVLATPVDASAPGTFALIRSRWRQLPGLLPHALISVAVFWWYAHVLHSYGVTNARGPSPLSAQHLGHLAWFTPLVIGQYLKLFLWPTEMSIWYTWPHVALALTSAQRIASVALALGLAAGTACLWRRRPELFAYWAMFLLFLLPYLNLSYIGIWVANRYLYLSSFCLLMMGARLVAPVWAMLAARGSTGRRLQMGLAGLVLIFGARGLFETVAFAQVFRNNESLWSYEVTRQDASLLSYQGLAREYRRQAEASPPGAPRQAAIARARAVIERALAYNRSIPWREAPGYLVPEIGYQSNLLVMRGQLAALEGQPLSAQLRDFRAADTQARTAISALMLGQTLERMSQEEGKPELAGEALEAYAGYVQSIATDPAQHATARALLQDFSRRFPALEARARKVEESLH